MAKINMAVRGISADFGPYHADTFTNDLHPTLKADFIITARFEICSAYCQLHNLSAARDALKGIEPYVYSDKIIAKYYRSLGYILIEEQNYKTAANAYQYSLFFEPDQQSAKQELLFIVNKAGFDVLDGTKDKRRVEKTLESAGITILSPDI